MPRPFVLVNVAATVDGKIDTVERRGAAISNDADRLRVDQLRAEADGVMVGPRTLVDEDPRLVVRTPALAAERVAQGRPGHPAKISILVRPDALPARARFLTAGPARIILLTATPFADSDLRVVRAAGAEVHCVSDGAGRVDLVRGLSLLHDLGLRRVLVEGGGRLNFELLRLRLVDEVQVYVAPLIVGGSTAPTLADGAGLSRAAAIRLGRPAVASFADGGVLLRYTVDAADE